MIERKLYCELEFWKGFSASQKCEDIIYLQQWYKFYGVLAKSNIVFNCSITQLKDAIASDEYLKQLWKRSTNGECNIECSDAFCQISTLESSEVFENNYNAIYLSSDNYKLEQYGILNMTTDKLLSYEVKSTYVYNDKICKISWRDYASYINHPCNSIILIDNYILKNEKSINTDFLDIMALLIPKVSKMPIHITVITNELKLSLQNSYDLAYEQIKTKCPNTNFYLTIYKSDKFHDRCIITNNSYITSGSGFDLFQGKGKSANITTISRSYLFNDFNITNIVELIITQVKKVCSTSIYIGSTINRLL